MTHTEQKKNTENPTINKDPKAIFLDSMEKLLVELDDLTEITENYLKNICDHQKNKEEKGEN